MIRLATPADIAALPDIERSAARAFADSAYPWVVDGDVTPAEAYPAPISEGLVWVAQAEGELAGYCLTGLEVDALHIRELAVRRDRQGRGLGRALMDAAIADARQRELPAVTLTTFADVAWNAPFYERLGFRALAQEDIDPRLTAILESEAARGLVNRVAMRLDLEP